MYLLCIYETFNDGTETRRTIKDYNTYNEALKVLFNEQSKAINTENVSLLTTVILTDKGIQCKIEVYNASTNVVIDE